MVSLEVLRIEGTRAVRVGTIERRERGQESCAYSESYLERSDVPLSQSPPLERRKGERTQVHLMGVATSH